MMASNVSDSDRNTSNGESERQNLLDRLLDAVKQCQVRFGGKSELATDGDSRISCLCTQWEAIFQHGLKRLRKGNALMQVTGLSKPEPDPVMWQFVKEHLNALELERFTILKNIHTDAGKGRAWLRSTLNEHTLEKYIHSFLGNVNLLRMFYDNEAFLLDGERSSMLAMMGAGLSSILFAINIDSEELNTVKQSHSGPGSKSISSLWSQYIPTPSQQQKTDLPSPVLSASTEDLFKSVSKTKKKKKKKVSANIVPIDDGDSYFTTSSCGDIHTLTTANTEPSNKKTNKSFVKGHTRSSSLPVWKPSAFATKTPEFSVSTDADSSSDTLEESVSELLEEAEKDNSSNDNRCSDNENSLSQQTNDGNSTNINKEQIYSNEKGKATGSKNFYFSFQSDTQNDQQEPSVVPALSGQTKQNNLSSIYSSRLDISENIESQTSYDEALILLDESRGSSLTPVIKERNIRKHEDESTENPPVYRKELDVAPNDNISISSEFSLGEEHSVSDLSSSKASGFINADDDSVNDITKQALAACSDVQRGMDQFTNFSSIARTLGDGRDTPEQSCSPSQDGMSTNELKQAIVSMMLRKDEVEEENRSLHDKMEQEADKLSTLNAELSGARKEMDLREERDSTRIQNLSRENELLKHQLKKYVGAVQLLRRDLQGHQSQDTDQGIRHEDPLPAIPEKKQANELSDYNLSKDYERKLIQVAEMHGELMEFNERLQRLLNLRDSKIRRLTEELIHLRGPLPEDNDDHSDISGLDHDHCLSSRSSRPLVNVWIPSAFIQGKSSNFHHVYQVYIRIRDDEWNVYRRYSQFHDMHKKDTKFVEERRRLLQEYIRHVVNLIVRDIGSELSTNTTKDMFVQSLPFFKDPYPPEKIKKSGSSTSRGEVTQHHYTGL